MTEEKGLKEEGEELAKTAVASGLGSKQLGSLYRQTLTKPIPFVEAFVKRQIGRGVPGFPGALGDRMLALLRKYEENKAMLERALMYANMLYTYYEVQSMMALKETVESLVKRMTERFGFDGIEISRRGQDMEIRVRLARFYGNRAALASEISAEILRRVPEASRLSFRVWIEQAERR